MCCKAEYLGYTVAFFTYLILLKVIYHISITITSDA